MYKIIDRTGYRIGKEFDNIKDAIFKIKKFRRSGLRVVVVDSNTRIKSKRNAKVSKNPTPEGPALETPGRGYPALPPEGARG